MTCTSNRLVSLTRVLVLLFAVSVLALAGCAQGPGQEDPTPDPAIELTLSRSTLEVLRGGSNDVGVHIVREGGADDPATLTIEGTLPTGVTATFDPPELTGGELSSTLLLTVDAAATEATLALEVVVESGELSDRRSLAVEVTGLTVVGRVEDQFGRALPGGRAGSQGQTVVVGQDGSFTLNDLYVPYDLMLGSGPGQRLHVFEGMTDPQPVVAPYTQPELVGGEHEATVEGQLLAGDPLGQDERVLICLEGHAVVIRACARPFPGDTAYTFDPTWFGGAQQEATLHAIHYLEGTDDLTTAYLGYDSQDVTLEDGQTLVWDLELERVGTSVMTGTIERGAGVSGGDLIAVGAVRVGKTLSMPVNGAIDEEQFSILMPDLPARSPIYDLLVVDGFNTSDTSFAWLAETGPDVGVVALLDLPVVYGPAPGEAGVSLNTPFGVTGLEGEVKTFVWSEDSTSGPMIAVTTTRDEVTIPDPSQIGLGGMTGAWQAMMWGVTRSMHPDVDSATRTYRELSELARALFAGGSAPLGKGKYAVIGEREFVFGPAP